MARKPRIEFAGAVYHVLSRGDHGENIYQDDENRKGFLGCLGEVCERTGWKALTNCDNSCLDQPKIENGGCIQADAGGECGGCK